MKYIKKYSAKTNQTRVIFPDTLDLNTQGSHSFITLSEDTTVNDAVEFKP